MISAPSGNLGQLCGIEHAMQPFAGRIDRVDEVASILDAHGDAAPAVGFEFGNQGRKRRVAGDATPVIVLTARDQISDRIVY